MSKKPNTKEVDHGVDPKHKNPSVESTAENNVEVGGGDKKADEVGKDTGAREPRSGDADKKSIVPPKYAGKYKNGGSDPLALFLTEHSQHPETKEFSFDRFFDIMEKNGIHEDHIKPFEEAIAEKRQGAAGRARMTLRNRLDTVVRKNGHVVTLDGDTHKIDLAPRANARTTKDKESAAA